MEARDIFQKTFKDDNERVFKIVRVKNELNVIIDGKPFFKSDVPYKLVKDVQLVWGTFECIQTGNGTELKIYFSNTEHQYVAMLGDIKANLCVMN